MKRVIFIAIVLLIAGCKHFDAKVTAAYIREPYTIESSHTESVRSERVGTRWTYDDVEVISTRNTGETFNLHIIDCNGEGFNLGLPTKDSLKFNVGDSVRVYQEALFGGVVKVKKLSK